MVDTEADGDGVHNEARELGARPPVAPDFGEGHRRPNSLLKSLLDELKRHPKPIAGAGEMSDAA